MVSAHARDEYRLRAICPIIKVGHENKWLTLRHATNEFACDSKHVSVRPMANDLCSETHRKQRTRFPSPFIDQQSIFVRA